MCVHPPFQYQFALRDRLGSTRVLIKDRYFDARDGYRGPSGFFEPEVLQVNDYYPFGLNHETQVAQQSKDFQFEYTGKERVKDLGVNYNDPRDNGVQGPRCRVRWYNASLGRWVVVDPLAGQFPSYSPYNYTLNNPINLIDPDGLAPVAPPGCCWGTNANATFARMTLDVQRAFGAMVDRVSLTLFGSHNTGGSAGSGNASASASVSVETRMTVSTNLENVFTYQEGATPSTDLVKVETTTETKATASLRVPVGPGNVGGSTTTTSSGSTTNQASAGTAAGGGSAKVYVQETTEGGETTHSAGAEVKATTPSVWGQSLSTGLRLNVNLDDKN